MEEIKNILFSLLKENEKEYVEYKEAKNDFDFNKLGKYFSALSNGANLLGKQYAWLIFGINDKTHEFVNTNYRKNKNLNELKKEITKFTNDNISFIDIYEFDVDNKRVIMFKIPAAIGIPTTWQGIAYDRNDDETIPLNEIKRSTILSTVNIDWSRQIIDNLTVNDLDKEAIIKAREQFKKKNENKEIAKEVDNMDDIAFLNKVKVLLNGKVTRTAWLLLGSEDTNTYVDNLIINEAYVPPYYRNQFLAQAMVNLNMIDTAGMGIRRSFEKLRQRLFPMPDYDLSEKSRVKVILYGKILDETYSQLLFEKTNLTLEQVMLLDRVQKDIQITREQSDMLKVAQLVEGRYPNIYVSKSISVIVNDKVGYTKMSGLNDEYYKDLVLKYINNFGQITKQELDELLLDKLPANLTITQKKTKIKYLVNVKLQRVEKKIENTGTTRYPIWKNIIPTI